MKTGRILQHLLIATIGLVLGASAALIDREPASAVGSAYIYTGFGTMCEDWGGNGHPCWHYNETSFPTFGALDMDRGMGSDDDFQNVFWLQGTDSSSYLVPVQFQALTMTTCTGVRVTLSGTLAGSFHYKHMDPAPGVIGSNWQNYPSWPGWWEGNRYLGTTSTSQTCPFSGPHLHQSGDTDWWTDIWRNHPAQTQCTSSPVRWCWSSYAFTVNWP